jgi:hypothetical protein
VESLWLSPFSSPESKQTKRKEHIMKQLINTMEKESKLAALIGKAYMESLDKNGEPENPIVTGILAEAMEMLGF